jgi:hypothetical protein
MRAFAHEPKVAQRATSTKPAVPDRAGLQPRSALNLILDLQRTIGNQAVQRLLEPAAVPAGNPADLLGRIPLRPSALGPVQQKSVVDTPGDSSEREADHISDQVLGMAASPHQRAGTLADRSSSPAHHQTPTTPAMAPGTEQAATSPIVHEVLSSSGRPLDAATRAVMEPRFGHDFSRVRVHFDKAAERSARQLHARAYTVGQHIVFGAGQFSSGTHEGRRLLAHELAHVIQQGDGQPVLQRKEMAGEEFVPCGVTDWDTAWHIYGSVRGGPFVDQGIKLPYDKIAPLPDPTSGGDEKEQGITYLDPSRLEQLYHDATVPWGSSQTRRQALWFVCNIEAVTRKLGEDCARWLAQPTLGYHYINWNSLRRKFSDATASGQRNRGILLKGFTDKAFELNLSMQIINNTLLLLGGISAAGRAFGGTGGLGSTPLQAPTVAKPPTTVEPVKPPTTVEPVKPPTTVEPVKPPTTVEPVKPPTTVEPVKPPPTKQERREMIAERAKLAEKARQEAQATADKSKGKGSSPPPPPTKTVPPKRPAEAPASRRNQYPEFEDVPKGLEGTAKEQCRRLSSQLGMPIREDRVLAAPWIGRIRGSGGKPRSSSTSEGWLRNESKFWAKWKSSFPEDAKLLGPNNTVTPELATKYGWPTSGPNNTVGQKLVHHHMENGTLTAAIPESVHQQLSGEIHATPTVVGE